jgi:rRNA-processing protein FCF1
MNVFVDTNILLHCVPLDQINWKELVKEDEITLVVPLVVLNEMDKHKRNPKYRKRCASFTSLLQSGIRTGQIRNGINVTFLHSKVRDDVFDTYNLIRSENDDVFLAEIKSYQQKNPDDQVVLVTADSSFQLRCSYYGIPVIQMPEKYELIEEDEQAVENKRLKAENQRLQNAIPKVEILFKDGMQTLDIEIEKPDFEEWRRTTMRSLRTEYGKTSVDSLEIIRRGFPNTSSLDINVHNDNLERFYKAYDSYLQRRKNEYIDTHLAVPLDIIMKNVGSYPAKNICIELFFPEGLKIAEHIESDDDVDEPVPPSFEYQHTKFMDNFSPKKYSYNYPIAQTIALKGKGDLDISRNEEKYVASVELESLQHNKSFRIDPFYAIFNDFEDVRGFSIDCVVTADNIPKDAPNFS